MKRTKVIVMLIIMGLFLGIIGRTYVQAVTVTKEGLQQSFTKLNSKIKLYFDYDISMQDSVIKATANGKTYDLKYDLTGKPTFTAEIKVKNGMSFEEYQKEIDAVDLPLIGYAAVATMGGANFRDVVIYGASMQIQKPVKQLQNEETPDFSNKVMEYVDNSFYSSKESNDSTYINSYRWIIEKKDVTETSCTIVSKIIVNSDANFAILSGAEQESTTTTSNDASEAAIVQNSNKTETQKNETKKVTTVQSTGDVTATNNKEEKASEESNTVKDTQGTTLLEESKATVLSSSQTKNSASASKLEKKASEVTVLPYAGIENIVLIAVLGLAVLTIGFGVVYSKYREIK